MTRFQSHQGVHFHKKEDVIGEPEVPDNVPDLLLFFRRYGHGAIKTEP